MKRRLPIETCRIRHFKAVQDSGVISFSPLTVFIGNNGSGKSSVLEALEFVRTFAFFGLDRAVKPWRSFQHIWNQTVSHEFRRGDAWAPGPMSFAITGHNGTNSYRAESEISEMANRGVPEFKSETLTITRLLRRTRADGLIMEHAGKSPAKIVGTVGQDDSILGRDLLIRPDRWSFLSLEPSQMAEPRNRSLHGGGVGLAKSGQNLAEYLLNFYLADQDAFAALLDALRQVLPYLADLRPRVLEDAIEKRIILQMREHANRGEFDLPGWVLSTGTMRILGLLAALRHPTSAPSVLFVDELENGLDPRTIGFLISEIREAVESGRTQVIATTHSPYLLDQLALEHLVLVERGADGAPQFTRPAENAAIQEWAKRFAPGALYSMGTLTDRL